MKSNTKENKRYTNLAYLYNLCRGSNEFVLKVIDTFIRQMKTDIGKMRQYIEEKNWDSLHFIAHKMKPSFQFVGIKELQDVIVNIEKYAKERSNLDLLPQLLSQLITIYDASVKELEGEVKKLKILT